LDKSWAKAVFSAAAWRQNVAKRVLDKTLDSRTARAGLKVRGKPYYRAIGPGLHIGYRKGKKGGRWVARLYAGDGNYRVEALADADDMLDADGKTVLDFWQAQEAARNLHTLRTKGGERASRRYTVAEAIEDYLDWMEGARKSAQDTRYRAEALILPKLGKVDTAQLTAKQIRKWQHKLAETAPRLRTKPGEKQQYRHKLDDADAIRRRRASANRTLTVLKAALNRAWREGHVASDAEWRRVEPYEAVGTARTRYLTIAEAQRLVNASEPSFRMLVQAALQTGARYGEIAALTVADFNPDSGTVTIQQSKSGKARHIVLTDEGAAFFRAVTVGRDGSDVAFTTKTGGTWTKSAQTRPMAEACRIAKISPPIGFHGLRHTWASHAVMNGVPLLVVAKNLGHADTRMVEKHYGHLAPSYVADAIRAGAPRFGTVEPSNVASVR
jgi:integrase